MKKWCLDLPSTGVGENYVGKCLNCHEELMAKDIQLNRVEFKRKKISSKLMLVGNPNVRIYLVTCKKCEHIFGSIVHP